MQIPRSLPVLLLAALTSWSPAPAQTAAPTGAELDEAARVLVARYSARTILRDAELDTTHAAALTADWPTDMKLALALESANEKQLAQQISAVTARLPPLLERLKNDLFVESWLRNRLAEIRDASLQQSAEAVELRVNESAAPRVREVVRAQARLRATLGDTVAAFEQAFRAAVRNQLAKNPGLVLAIAAALDSRSILESRSRLMTALTDAESRLKP